MSATPHALPEAFPDHQDLVKRLRAEHAHFAKLADDYDVVNESIHRGETNIEPMDDFHMEDLRKQRLRLLDEISAMLREASS
ncbi:MAG: YdcH family protein [Pseudomonadota bacterium]